MGSRILVFLRVTVSKPPMNLIAGDDYEVSNSVKVFVLTSRGFIGFELI